MRTKAISRETGNVQNPALGAALIWRFAVGYTAESKTSDFPILQFCFLVPPVIFHRETFELLSSTRVQSSIHQFVDKFTQTANSQSDVLLSLHDRVASMRRLTLDSIRIGVNTRLVTIASATGKVIPLSETAPRGVSPTIKPLLSNAEKLGRWCSGLSIFEISSILKVRF